MSGNGASKSENEQRLLGQFMYDFSEKHEAASGWLMVGLNWRVVRDDCALVMKRVNVDDGRKEVAFFYAGSVAGCIRKAREEERGPGIKWRVDRY